jgi:UDP-2,4-diacetamido-2,4,6-trideoxy-beta-L-altropyranose hydrolase
MKVAFRVDSSIFMGSGHLMRCLTLAKHLASITSEVVFISRSNLDHLSDLIISEGFPLIQLSPIRQSELNVDPTEEISLNSWLGVSQYQDARETSEVIRGQNFDWIVVDHYALDHRWERILKKQVKRILVIDDLANRSHDCDILLDQNWLSNKDSRYDLLTSEKCQKLLGPKYALLRPEFHKQRKTLKIRGPEIQRVFVCFGAVDSDNLTTLAVRSLSGTSLSRLDVDVVIGARHPHRNQVEDAISARPKTKLFIQTQNIAAIMASADLAIGAGGSTNWERFCLNLPSVVVTTADNQVVINKELAENSFISLLGNQKEVTREKLELNLCNIINQKQFNFNLEMYEGCDGLGACRVADRLLEC